MLRAPLPVGPGHRVQGQLKFEANESRGYNLHVELTNAAPGVKARVWVRSLSARMSARGRSW